LSLISQTIVSSYLPCVFGNAKTESQACDFGSKMILF
jgi:hypothetical protein